MSTTSNWADNKHIPVVQRLSSFFNRRKGKFELILLEKWNYKKKNGCSRSKAAAWIKYNSGMFYVHFEHRNVSM